LESAGARVVPVNFNLDHEKMKTQLKQLNGLYIPGNSKTLVSHGDYPYTKTVQRILRWAQVHNEVEDQHFPIMGIGYGMLSLIKS
jgi:phosphoribosylformylglycinamidine (FGAM) synthase-like amidotransferase family enzyme